MSKLISLRLYFHHSERAQAVHASRFWHRIARPSLARHLLHHAKNAGIEQAILHRVHAGYLGGDRVHHEHVEVAHHHFPHCLELIDLESKVRAFWSSHGKGLRNVRAVFLPCESAALEA
jgi:PII-like signaling protein